MSTWLYTAFIALVGLERLAELVVSKRNAAWSFANGGKEFGLGHFPFMVVLHTGFLIGCVAEVWLLGRLFSPVIGLSMLVLALLTQALRWWCILTLGQRWNTRVIIVPGLPRITGGPYKYLSHPNYVAVVLEGIALPMIHGAWLTALIFNALNGILLWTRIRVEEAALDEMEQA